MSAQPIERTELEVIEALDFDFTPLCESVWHGVEMRFHEGPAFALIAQDPCPGCGHRVPTGYRCQKWVEAAMGGRHKLRCDKCQTRFSGGITILGYVGGAS